VGSSATLEGVKVSDSEIQNLEWRVVEAAVKWRDSLYGDIVQQLGGASRLDKLHHAVNALITARDQVERKDLADARNKTV